MTDCISRRPFVSSAIVISLGLSFFGAGAGVAQSVLPLVPVAAAPLVAIPADRQATAFRQAIAEAAAADAAVAAFYQDRDYAPLWTSQADAERRAALLSALAGAGVHALPVGRYAPETLISAFRAARTEGDRGRLEVMMSLAFLDYARDVQTGALVPAKVDAGIVREVPVRDRRANLNMFAQSVPSHFLKSLPPASQDYALLIKAKFTLERLIQGKGWGPAVQETSLKPGDQGPAVLQLRDRLVAMGYLSRSATRSYDAAIQRAVQLFQTDHGLEADGIAGAATITEINIGPERRLESVIVAIERERWMNIERGKRHIWVNLTDFTAKIIDNGKVTFSTRSVIGKDTSDRRSPEFSDMMEYMVINPSWNVPRSITTKEYLPMMQRDPNAAGHLKIVDSRGRVVPRDKIDFAAYTTRTFPYSMRQPPSDDNALGLVKFMFPNPYNIYLHDTPSKSLFQREVRAFSHGCVRLSDPFDFAYALLARQSEDPVGEFARHLKTKAETNITLVDPVPVHLVYFTAFPSARGQMNYRRDVYGRDGRIFEALRKAGVVPGAYQG